MLQCYSTKAASRRWPLAAFFNLLDIICSNSFVIAKNIGMTHGSRRDFLFHLGELLCATERQRRAASRQPIQSLLHYNRSKAAAMPDGKRITCRLFQKRKTRNQCCNCRTYVCGSCAKSVCQSCLPL